MPYKDLWILAYHLELGHLALRIKRGKFNWCQLNVSKLYHHKIWAIEKISIDTDLSRKLGLRRNLFLIHVQMLVPVLRITERIQYMTVGYGNTSICLSEACLKLPTIFTTLPRKKKKYWKIYLNCWKIESLKMISLPLRNCFDAYHYPCSLTVFSRNASQQLVSSYP